MARLLFLGGLVALSLLCATAAASDVVTLTDATFDSFAKAEPFALIEFYAPWCGHCKKLAPEYEQAASDIKRSGEPVKLAKVDCTEEKNSCSKHGVSGYPTLKIFRDGVATDYNGPREARGIVSYLKKQAGPASKVLSSAADVTKFLAANNVVVVGNFAKSTSAEAKIFGRVASKLRDDYKFGEASTADAKAALANAGEGVLVYLPALQLGAKETRVAVLSSFSSDSEVEDFIAANCLPLVGEVNEDNHARYDARKLPLVVVLYKVDFQRDPKGTNYIANRIRRVAADYKGKVLFAIADRDNSPRLVEQHGLSDRSVNFPVALKSASGLKYGHKSVAKDGNKLDEDALRAFVTSFLDGKEEPYLKSEPIPSDNSGPVKTLVAKNFDAIVNDEEKDVFVEFYAPWCGHCKSLAPIWDQLGEKTQDSNVVIAKMDATANDVPPPFEVSGFPTLYWVPKGSKKSPEKYNGGRELKDLTDYVKSHASGPVPGLSEAGGKKAKKEKKAKKGGPKEDL